MLSIIVAYDKNRVIGFQNQLPWHLPEDLARLKTLTTGKTIVMGRKTFDAIGRALPNRNTIVLTYNKDWSFAGVETITSLEAIFEKYLHTQEEVFIFGGQAIFEQTLPFVEKIYATVLTASFKGDRFFPKLNSEEWLLQKEEVGDGIIPHTYQTYTRRKNNVSLD